MSKPLVAAAVVAAADPDPDPECELEPVEVLPDVVLDAEFVDLPSEVDCPVVVAFCVELVSTDEPNVCCEYSSSPIAISQRNFLLSVFCLLKSNAPTSSKAFTPS